MSKYIFVTGGVVSGIGKGIIAASVGNILTNLGYSVSIMKCDPYLNMDPGTMNPKQHGEVFVTDDGGETDLDLGHYERFINTPVSKINNITTGQAYNSVMLRERDGYYKGSTVQIIPHITDEIKRRIYSCADQSNCDYLIVEVGGTIGDLESQPFMESLHQIQVEQDENDTCYIHVSYIPYLDNTGELKTKPTQHSCKELRSLGINPDILVARSKDCLDNEVIRKLSKYCYFQEDYVIPCPNADSLYRIPYYLINNGLLNALKDKLSITRTNYDDSFNSKSHEFSYINNNRDNYPVLRIAIVGKYASLEDSYLSIKESLLHASVPTECVLDIVFVDTTSEYFDCDVKSYDAIVIPGGFGESGTAGILELLEQAFYEKVPVLGICYGMQLMCIFLAEQLLGLQDCSSTEINPCCQNPIIDILPEKKDLPIGGTLRLGSYPTILREDTLLKRIYGSSLIYERHRHRYEFNNSYRGLFSKSDKVFISGLSPDNKLVESIEVDYFTHPFFIGVQYHPEFKSTLLNPHPLFISLLQHTLNQI